MPRPSYANAGENRDRPRTMPSGGKVLRRELQRARVVTASGDFTDGDLVTYSSAAGAVVSTAPTAPYDLVVKDEGSTVGSLSGGVDTIDFAGAGVTVTKVGNVVTVTIP